ncbi:MAG TPA: hypothetical protein VMQ62_03645, partial [Dongiaceae bacterium]|nr:hypothetical protein [Dongiaceae bacterium]
TRYPVARKPARKSADARFGSRSQSTSRFAAARAHRRAVPGGRWKKTADPIQSDSRNSRLATVVRSF